MAVVTWPSRRRRAARPARRSWQTALCSNVGAQAVGVRARARARARVEVRARATARATARSGVRFRVRVRVVGQ